MLYTHTHHTHTHSLTHTGNINLLTPNVNYSGRTEPLTSKIAFYTFIQQIQVLNILNMVYAVRFFPSKCSLFHNSNVFGSCIIHILYTGVPRFKKNNSGAKMLNTLVYLYVSLFILCTESHVAQMQIKCCRR